MLCENEKARYQLRNWPESHSKVSQENKSLLLVFCCVFCVTFKAVCHSLTKQKIYSFVITDRQLEGRRNAVVLKGLPGVVSTQVAEVGLAGEVVLSAAPSSTEPRLGQDS